MRIKRAEGLKHRSLIRIMWIFEPFNGGWPAFNESGEFAPRPRGHRQALFDAERLKGLDQLLQQRPDATLEELKVLCEVDGSIMAIKRAVDRLGYRYKKNAPRQRTRTRRC